jgi:hypothetical protein
MPNYVQKALSRFKHPPPSKPEHSPHPWNAPKYGQRHQYAPTITPNTLTPQQQKQVQEFVGTFLYYARAIDSTMLPAIGSIATAMTTSSWPDLSTRIRQFLNYAATHPNAKLVYRASPMQLWVHSDASYLSEPKAQSRAGGFFYLSNKPKLPITENDPPPHPNAPILVNSKIIDAVMSSAQESETGAGFINAKDAIPIRNALEEMQHPQGPTPLQFDNKCATGLANETIAARRSKAMDMRFYWLRDRIRQNQFHVHWKRAETNLADYPTKHHPTKHHIAVRHKYVLNNTQMLLPKQIYKGV